MSSPSTTPDERLLSGSYTPPQGEGAGIGVLERRGEEWSTRVVARMDSPSYLARHPRLPVLYAVAEHRGELLVLDLADDRSARLAQDPLAAGPAACHVRVADDGSSVVVACWGDGAVIRYALDARGRVTGSARGAEAGAGSRAHASVAVPGGFATTDLGLDLLRVWRETADGIEETQRLELPAGCGPRHLVAHPNGRLYVDTEYSVEILVIESGSDGMLRLAGRSPARPDGAVDGDTAAEIALDPTGEWLTVGVRGSDVIAASRIHDDGSTRPHSETPAGGVRPRHHVHDERGLLVAHESSHTVARIPFDPRDGGFGEPTVLARVGSPSYLLPFPIAG